MTAADVTPRSGIRTTVASRLISGGILRGSLSQSFMVSTAVQALNALTGVLLAHSLGATARGELAAAVLWPSLLTMVGSLGLSDSIAYHTARAECSVRSIVGSIAAIWLVQSLAIWGIGALVVPHLLRHDGTRTIHASLLFLLFVPFFLGTSYSLSILQGLRRFGHFQALRLAQIVGTVIGLVSLVCAGVLGVESAVAVYLTTYVVVSVAAIAPLRGLCSGLPTVDRALLRSLVAFAVRSHTTNVSSMLNERLDQLLISAFLAPVQLGLYVVALTLTSATTVVGQSVSLIALPIIAAEAPGERRTSLVRRYVRLTLAISCAITVPLIVLAPQVIDICFGGSFVRATSIARLSLLAAVILSTTRVVQALLKAAGRPLDAGISEFLALGVTIVALAALLPWLGILGAALASLLAYSVSAFWTFRRAARSLGLGSVRMLAFAPVARGGAS